MAVMSSPSKWMVPLDGGDAPANQVDEGRLARAIRSDNRAYFAGFSEKSTSLTACRPPKDLLRSSSSRSAVTAATSPTVRARAEDAFGEEQDEQHECGADDAEIATFQREARPSAG